MFVVFGVMGLGASNRTGEVVVILLLVTICQLVMYLNRYIIKNVLTGQVSFSFSEAIQIIIFTVVLSLTSNKFLESKLTEDEIAYAQAGYVPSSKILQVVLNQTKWFDNFTYVKFLWISSLIMIILGISLVSKIYKIQSDRNFMVIISILTLLMNIVIGTVLKNGLHNTPAFALWYLPSSLLFGLSDSAFRLSTNLLFALVGVFLFRKLLNATGSSIIATLSVCTFFTVPVINQLSGMVEISIFAFLANVIVIAYLCQYRFVPAPWMLYFASISFYFRITNAALLFALIGLALSHRRLVDSRHIVNSVTIAAPGLLAILFERLHRNTESGSTAIPNLGKTLQNYFGFLVESNTLVYSFCFVAFFSVVALKFRSARGFVVILFLGYLGAFLILTGAYFNHSKYLLEYIYVAVPCLGFLHGLADFRSRLINQSLKGAVFMILICVNIFGLTSANDLISNTRREIETNVNSLLSNIYLPHDPYPYGKAYDFIRRNEIEGCMNVGVVYGTFPDVLERISIKEFKNIEKEFKKLVELQQISKEDWTSVTVATIEKLEVDCLMLGNVKKKELVVRELLNFGWEKRASFYNSIFGTSVLVMTKK
jgi:hypothetical protein